MIKPETIYADLIGKEFRYGARGPKEFDCYGLCMEVLKRRGVELPDFGSAVQTHVIHKMVLDAVGKGAGAIQESPFEEIAQPEPWCLVTFWVRPGYTSHVGIVLEDRSRFLHILRKELACIERLDSLIWKHRITGYYRLSNE